MAIIAVRSSKQSRELADYYAAARGIPKEQIHYLEISAGELLSRADWEVRVRPGLRRWLAQNKLEDKIRCFVTVWDVPLRIGPVDPRHPVIAELKQHLESQRATRGEQLLGLAAEMDGLLPPETPPDRKPPASDAAHQAFSDHLDATLRAARDRIKAAQERQDPRAGESARALEQLFFNTGGLATILRTMQAQLQATRSPTPELVRLFEYRRGELTGLRGGQAAIASLRESVDRDMQELAMLQQSDGLLGTLAWIDLNLDLWKRNETYSSFDSELALLNFPPYGLLRWQNSALYHGYNRMVRATLPRTLMVARLEAPTFELARQLVDTAIEIEKTGLEGKVYIDARGIAAEKAAGPGSYADFDQSLRDLATLLQEHTSLEVVLDNESELFAAGSCPDAALYCGWYSLSKYVDAFDWKRGAVGYHLASGEAATLRQAASNVWCKRMLEDGVAATLGPTYEPYLGSFPRPLDFFPLLVSGQLTLAEVYARTNPHNSWVMTLVGDPLYNPFRERPAFAPGRIPESVARLLNEGPSVPPVPKEAEEPAP